MEFLDSLDFESNKKTDRVRSWYLYEQFKSLESNQLEAAKKLKSRYYQEKVLRRELSERKARRSLYDYYDRSRTESRVTTSVRSVETKSSLEASNDDILDGCFQLEDEQIIHDEHSLHGKLSENDLAEHEVSQDDSHIDNPSSDFKSIADLDDSIASVVENLKDSENITDEIKEELEFVKHGIAENISLQLETAKGNIQCLEEFSEFCVGGEHFDNDHFKKESYECPMHLNIDKKAKVELRKQENSAIVDNQFFAVWMKLVSFAYQIIKLNHGGNCYCDYSSQFLTAVLACDVIRRGFSRMSDILQPYVCPIVFVNDETQSPTHCFENNSKNKYDPKKSYNVFDVEPCSSLSFEIGTQHRKKTAYNCLCCNKKYKSENAINPTCEYQCQKKYHSENYSNAKRESRCCSRKYNSENYSKYSAENRNTKKRKICGPLQNIASQFDSLENSKNNSSFWPSEYQSEKCPRHSCHCCAIARNPMLKIAKYIDDVLVHMDHS